MRKTLKRSDYLSMETKEAEAMLKEMIKTDKIRARARKTVDSIPEELQQEVLNILSAKFATK